MGPRFASMDIIRIIRIRAHRMDTMDRSGLTVGSLSAPGPGITGGAADGVADIMAATVSTDVKAMGAVTWDAVMADMDT